MNRAVMFALAAAVGCGPSGDPLAIRYTYAIGDEQACLAEDGDPVQSCTDIPMTCDSVAMLRIVNIEDPNHIYVEQCVLIPNNSPQHDLCPINQAFTADPRTFPTDRVAVQIAVYALEDLQVDEDGLPICPSSVAFTASGFVAPTSTPQPALAGMAYTDGYDSEVIVELGCNDTGQIDTEVCRNENTRNVRARVLDFDDMFDVAPGDEAQGIGVRVGQPTETGSNWIFDVASTFELPLVLPELNPPRWAADNVSVDLLDYACLQVLEPERSATAITCIPLSAPLPALLELIGIRIDQTTLDDILGAIGLNALPNNGLVIGKVVDNAAGVAGVEVTNTVGSQIQYLSADRMSVGGTTTSDNGIFIATDAAFETPSGAANHWSAMGTGWIQQNDPVGGQINFRVMVVIIEMDEAF